MAQYISGRQKNLKVGLTSYSEGTTSLQVTGNVGIATTNATSALWVAGDGYFTGVVTATSYYGDGSKLSNISAGVATYATYASTAGIATYATNAGIATIAGYASTAGIATYATSAGIATYATNAGIATIAGYASTAGIATAAQNLTGSPNITVSSVNSSGVITASQFVSNVAQGTAPITVGSSTLVTNLNAQYLNSQPGSYYQIANNLTGTVPPSAITASSGDFNVGQNLYVNGNLSIGGTTTYINAATLTVKDKDIVVGYTTDANNNDVSNDTTANHGGISVASTVGSPIINIPLQGGGINSNPSTYKQLMWIKQGNYSGMGTDAWVFNYAVSIGNTATVQNLSRLTVGAGFTVYDTYLDATDIKARNINATGIITASSFSGNASSATIAGYASTAGIATYATSAGIATYATNAGIATYATSSGISTYTTLAGVATNVIGGIASVTQLSVSGITTVGLLTAASIGIGTTNPTSALWVNGDGYFIGVITATTYIGNLTGTAVTASTVQISSGIITATSGVVTYYGDGSKLSNIISGVSISTNTTNQSQYIPYVTGTGSTTGFGITTTGLVFNPSSGNLGIGTTNPTSKLYVVGDTYVTGVVTASLFKGDGSQLTGLVPNTVSTSSAATPQYIGFLTTNSGTTTSILASSTLTYIPSTGALGIGTTNPFSGTANYGLDVNRASAIIQARNIGTTGGTAVWASDQDYFSTPSYKGTGILKYGTGTVGNIFGSIPYADLGTLVFQNTAIGLIYTNGGSPLIFGTLATEALRIDVSQRVGIGTANPTSKLHVVGDALFSGTGIVTATKYYGDGSSLSGINVTGNINLPTGINTIGFITSTNIYVSGIATLGRVQISSGIITATSGVVTYYGDGSKLSNVNYVGYSTYTGYALTSGISTSVIGGIGSITQLSVSGIATLGIVQISSGIITATSGVVTYYGDGSKLSGVNASGASGAGGTSGQIQYNNAGIITGASYFNYDNTQYRVGIGTSLPTARLSVASTSSGNSLLIVNDNLNDGTLFRVNDNSANVLMDVDANGTILFLNSGNIGIGSTLIAPATKLQVIGTVTATTFSGNLTGTAATISTVQISSGIITATFTGNLTGTAATISTVQISSGIITATSGVVTYYGFGGNLTGILTSGSAGGSTGQLQYNLGGIPSGANFFNYDNTQYRVGIGTSSPTARLSVASTSSGNSLLIVNDNLNDGTLFRVNDNSSNVLMDVDANGTILFLNSGNIGIGSTLVAPTSKLQVTGDVLISGVVTATTHIGQINSGIATITNLIGTAATISSVKISSGIITASTGVVTYYGDGSKLSGVVALSNVGAGASGQMQFNDGGPLGGAAFFNYDKTTARVGIGTSLPTARLSVASTITGASLMVVNDNLSDGSLFRVTDNSANILMDVDANGTILFLNSGNVGIGTTLVTPTSKLQVTGDILISGVITATTHFGQINSGLATITNITSTNINVIGITTTQIFNVGTGGTIIATTSAGNVGVGTITPTSRFNVTAPSSGNSLMVVNDNLSDGTLFRVNDSSANVLMDVDANGTTLFPSSTGTLSIGTYIAPTTLKLNVVGSAYLSGSIGIGTTNPTSKLHVVGNTLIAGVTTITGNLNAAGNYYVKLARTTNQTIPNGVDTLIGFSTISDPNSWYTGITTRTTPTVAGTYQVNVMLNWQAGLATATNQQTNIQLRKNGTSFALSQVGVQTFAFTMNACGIVTMNGTTDYIDLTAYTGNPTSQIVNGTADGAWTKLELFKIN